MNLPRISRIFVTLCLGFLNTIPVGIGASNEDRNKTGPVTDSASKLVEPFSAYTLNEGEFQLGTEINYGINSNFMLGSDAIGTFVGIPTLYTKYKTFENSQHSIAISAKAIWLNLDVLASWARAKSHYKTLNAKLIRPGITWTQSLSPRLKIHTYWTQGLGHIDVELSEEGKRRSWEQKHPGEEYEALEEPLEPEEEDEENEEISSDVNQEKAKEETSNIARRTLELQSLFGLSTDRFQISGEITRQGGNKIILTSRIEKMHFEELKANSIRFTVAQQWHHSSFHFRLGIGVMYLTITGTDLDTEVVDETGILPVTDLSFYWRF
ncbi:MAG: hypothetical protein AB8G05_18810 [Oligoflexales bacterium]